MLVLSVCTLYARIYGLVDIIKLIPGHGIVNLLRELFLFRCVSIKIIIELILLVSLFWRYYKYKLIFVPNHDVEIS